MSTKKKTLCSIVLFVLCFGGLLLIATFFDLKINDILTSKALADHLYLTNDTFGAAFEAIGDSPNYLVFAFAFSIIFVYVARFKKGALKCIVTVCMAACTLASYFVWLNSILGYLKQHLTLKNSSYELFEGAYLYVILAFVASFVAFLTIMAVNNFSSDSIKKLFKFAIAAIIVCALPTALINLGIKGYVGRIRYRAMNMYPDNEVYGFSAFARWYEHHGQWIPKDEMKALFDTTDALKSFPSGHTASAGVIYSLIMLNKSLDIKNKLGRALLWICPIVYTGTVAVSRMVVGAHFMSDVLVGGTLSFVVMILAREILICNCSNIKALFSKKSA